MNLALAIICGVVVLLVLLVAVAAARRFARLRNLGTRALVRSLPADDGRHWRHGIMRYRAEGLEFFKLRSVGVGADIILDRSKTKLLKKREPTAVEESIFPDDCKVIVIDHAGSQFELALDNRGEMAFTAWLESAPSRRLERSDPSQALRHLGADD